MVCCAIITCIIAGLLWPLRKVIAKLRGQNTTPLMWQLAHVDGASPEPSERFSMGARVKSFRYAIEGLDFVIRNEHNARIHIAAALFVVMIGTAYQIARLDWIILILAIVSVWFAETINTAFEYLCDVVSPEKNESVKHAKDIAAGAVLITALGAVIIGTIVMMPYVLAGSELIEKPMGYALVLAENLCASR